MDYLEANQGDATYLVAAIDSGVASPIILNTDEPVIAFGGFEGRDLAFSIKRLAGLVNQGSVRFFMIKERDIEHAARLGTAPRRLKLGGTGAAPRTAYAPQSTPQGARGHPRKEGGEVDNGQLRAVPQGLWQSSTSKSSTSTVLLYDCGSGAL